MIARIWHGSTRKEDADRYVAHLRQQLVPELSALDGYRGIQLLRRPREEVVDFIVTTFWDSMDAVRAFAGADTGAAVVAPAAQALLIQYDRHATHYEVAVRLSCGAADMP